MIRFMLITNDPQLASHAENCGVGRLFVDLEKLGKQERQGHLDTLISHHSVTDIASIKASLSHAELLVRLNPLNNESKREIDEAVTAGADLLMLPMFRSASEVERFVGLVNGRAGVVPLVETYDAAKSIDSIVCIPGVTEIYIGLNDLHLDMHLSFMFEPLANGLVDQLAQVIKAAGLPFGFGGIARVGEGIIPGELVLAEHQRLGSSSVILSRTFHRKSESVSKLNASFDLESELVKLYAEEKRLTERSDCQIIADQKCFQDKVAQFIESKKL